MAIAIDTAVWGAANTAGPNYDTAITPAATPNGVCVAIVQSGSASDLVTSVAYGTVAGPVTLSRAASPYGFASEPTEAGAVYLYWSGDSAVFPTGAQTVRIVRGSTTRMRAVIWTMTCTAGQVVALDSGATGQSASVANPSWAHTSLAADVVAFLAIHSGLNAMTTTQAAGWTKAVGDTTSEDTTGTGTGWAQRTLGTAGALSPGWTATADDFVGASIAFKEAAPPAPPGRKWKNLPIGTRRSQTASHQAANW